jgi:hypothetical protein
MEGMHKVSVTLTGKEWRAFKVRLAREGKTAQAVILVAVRRYIKAQRGKGGKAQ